MSIPITRILSGLHRFQPSGQHSRCLSCAVNVRNHWRPRVCVSRGPGHHKYEDRWPVSCLLSLCILEATHEPLLASTLSPVPPNPSGFPPQLKATHVDNTTETIETLDIPFAGHGTVKFRILTWWPPLSSSENSTRPEWPATIVESNRARNRVRNASALKMRGWVFRWTRVRFSEVSFPPVTTRAESGCVCSFVSQKISCRLRFWWYLTFGLLPDCLSSQPAIRPVRGILLSIPPNTVALAVREYQFVLRPTTQSSQATHQ